jgi:Ca2+/Na+ antiporter
MFNKIGKYIRKIHRHLTPVFVVITILYMFVIKEPFMNMIQRVLMLTMAFTGTYLYVQIYYNKLKVKKKKKKNL